MTERYDGGTAGHYAAYRPPLHRMILERILEDRESFESGLDLGCGTGCSTEALKEYCREVCGLDLSEEMLALAKPQSGISYRQGSFSCLEELPERPFDVVSFAGSLFYTKSSELRASLIASCRPAAAILVYDFEVLLEGLLVTFGIRPEKIRSDYDHAIGLDDWEEFELVSSDEGALPFELSAKEAAHLLLSDSNHCDALREHLGNDDLFEGVVKDLSSREEVLTLEARVWHRRYRLAG